MEGGIDFQDLPVIRDIIAIEGSYGTVCFTVLAIFLHYFLVTGHLPFSKQFVDEHREVLGSSPAAYGYPDMGSGKHAERLDYRDWVLFNNAQRVQYNYVEDMTIIVFFTLVAGLYFPKTATVFGILYLVGRIIYSCLYLGNPGPDGRKYGAVVMLLSKIVNAILAGYSGSLYLGLNDQTAA
eukprot:CAMPEP_0115039098 /NCGR_PEP_ID=MMETSP0216-20121206/43805_1 /TAXON_ID=223996 /ORGANISM="Protocruzia adherens, Strain Boccale" /LENGTH=180 /DNA_ID=CAMNT_0002419631 /DNA_START=23 /DNA_END=565 /DNA_ORIENTATION=-